MTRLSGHFIEGTQGPLYVAVREPVDGGAGGVRGCVLVVPPFAEEMNKTRRMVAELSIRLAARAIVTVVPDLYGTGDSAGDFGDADWQTWQRDIGSVAAWAAARGSPVDRLLAIRLGAALALDCIASGNLSGTYRHTVFWQPVFDGARFVTQFLRLRAAASLNTDRKETVAELKSRLVAGERIEVAGYLITGILVEDLQGLNPPNAFPDVLEDVTCIEVQRDGTPSGGVSASIVERAARAGQAARLQVCAGEPYWASVETVVNHDVLTETVQALDPR